MPAINQYMPDLTHMGVYNYQQLYKRDEIAAWNEARDGTTVRAENHEDVALVEVEKREGVDEWGDMSVDLEDGTNSCDKLMQFIWGCFGTVFGFGVGSGIVIPY
ncbi:hypothetical protein AB5N19_06932 [Seiridium cardinale]|uniref:Uncharacterized protein n=1 Tax=Seiridium cardinale TaxID=138064 RepID=A0ABR2XJS8_9PEZI